MKSQYLPLVLLCCALLAGCGKKNKKNKANTKKRQEVFTQVDIPTAGNEANFLFDDNNEFSKLNDNIESDANILGADEFSWLEADDIVNNEEFKTVYFDFDKKSIRADQEKAVERNITIAKEILDEGSGDETLVVKGHACDSAGSRAYNLALSGERAKALRDRLAAEGIPSEKIKIVACGSEIPAVIDGKQVKGDRIAQAPNRRDEIRVVYN